MWAVALLVAGLVRVPMLVHKHSLWSAFELRNEYRLRLPPQSQVTPVRIFRDSPRKKLLLFNEYRVSSPFFSGRRLEVCVVVRRRSQTHFVVLDCLSDTLLWDPVAGVQLPNSVPNTERSFNSRNGRVAVRAQGNDRRRGFRLRASMRPSRHPLSAEFAVDPNRECFFSSHPVGFPMDFNETEVLAPVQRLKNVHIETDLWSGFRGRHVSSFVHPCAMRYTVHVPSFDV